MLMRERPGRVTKGKPTQEKHYLMDFTTCVCGITQTVACSAMREL